MAAQAGVVAATIQAMMNQDPAGHQHFQDLRTKLISLCMFSATASGPADVFLLQHGSVLRDPDLAASMTFDEVIDVIEAHNKANREFGQGITMAMSMFVQALVHHYESIASRPRGPDGPCYPEGRLAQPRPCAYHPRTG